MEDQKASHPHMDLTPKIIGAAMAVHRALGPGLDEKIYENALAIELATRSLSFTQQQQFPVFYREQSVGRLITDLIITKLKVGLILNFKPASLVIKRAANIYLKNQ